MVNGEVREAENAVWPTTFLKNMFMVLRDPSFILFTRLSIVQIIFSFWSFDISEDILRKRKIIIGLDAFSNQRLLVY